MGSEVPTCFRALVTKWWPQRVDTTSIVSSPPHEIEAKDAQQQKQHVDECSHPEDPSYALFSSGLPVELWLLIVKYALEPRFAIMHEFLPEHIHFFYTSLIIHAFSCPDRTEFKRTKGSLRLVCKFLHSIVDEMSSIERQNPSWIWSFSASNARRYGPCLRLDTRFHKFDDIPLVEQQYQHEVGTASIHIQWTNPSDSNPSLSSLLAYPWALKVLHITTPGQLNGPGEIPFSILSGLLSLQTLSIAAPKPLELSGKLDMPQLTTLFLTCMLDPQSDLSQWSFAKLKKLAIDARGWPCRGNMDDFPSTFNDLVQRHRETIMALRLIPLGKPPFTPFSRQKPMPQLETLATDFARYSPQSASTSRSTIEHVTHISTLSYTRRKLAKALLETVKTFPLVRTLAITEDPFLESEQIPDGGEEKGHASILDELEELCRSRKIRIVGKIGSDVCCVSKALNSLKVPRVISVQNL